MRRMRAHPPGDPYHGRIPTTEEAWTAFWEVIGPALVDAYREGKVSAWALEMSRSTYEELLLSYAPQPTNREIRLWTRGSGVAVAKHGPIPRRARLTSLQRHVTANQLRAYHDPAWSGDR